MNKLNWESKMTTLLIGNIYTWGGGVIQNSIL